MQKDKFKLYLKYMLVILWCALVFFFSSQVGEDSGETSSRFLNFFFNIFGISTTSDFGVFCLKYIRKAAHFSLYTLGGILLYNLLWNSKYDKKKSAFLSFLFGTFYAVTDEFHQLFVPGRSGEIRDVIIDSSGVLTGICLYAICRYIIYKMCEKT